jgi:prepilin-type N-terminal cleavage/methylation domain-containing protein
MRTHRSKTDSGFSLIELTIAMVIMLALLAIVSTLMGQSMSIRARESRKADALASAQAALNVLSREIGNSGYGIYDDPETNLANNGIVLEDSDSNRIHFRANVTNAGGTNLSPGPTTLSTNEPSEDVTYFFDSATESIVRYDPNGTPKTSVVVNRVSNVTFQYFDYAGANSAATGPLTVPTANTGRIRLTVEVLLEPVVGQPDNQRVTFTSDVTLRNANYMLRQY